VLLLTCPSEVSTTAKPLPTGTGLPSVVVTIPSPVIATTVTCEVAGSELSVRIKVSPALTGETVPRGVTMTTEACAKLCALESKTRDPLLRVSLICGSGLPAASTVPASTVSPMINSLDGCNSTKMSFARRNKARPSLPTTTIAPAGNVSLTLLAPSTGTSPIFTTTCPSDEASKAVGVDSAAVAVQIAATTTVRQAKYFTA
jgi:hypothetical protein